MPQSNDERAFRKWYARWSKVAGLDPNPDHPLHKYDYRAAFRAGVVPKVNKEDGLYHWPSKFKADDHPNRVVKGVDTKALDASGVAPRDATTSPKPGQYAPGDSPAKASVRRGRTGSASSHVVPQTDFVQDVVQRLRSHPWEVLPGAGEGAVAGEVTRLAKDGRPGLAAGLALAAAVPGVGVPLSKKLARELAKKGGKISASAIKMPNGKVLEGTSHFDAMERGGVSNSPMLKKAVSGYVDQAGNFLTLDEAGQRMKHLGLAGDAWKNARSEEIVHAQKGYAPKFEKAKTARAVGDSVATRLPSMEIPLNPSTRAARLPHRAQAEQLLEKLKSDGGFTLDAAGRAVTTGFAVGAGKLPGANLLEKPLAELTVVDVENFLAKHPKDKLLGGWVNEKGVVYLEPSDRIPTKAAAVKLGRARGEQAVGDLAAYARGDFDAGTIKTPKLRYESAPHANGTQVKAFDGETPVGSLFLDKNGEPIMVNVSPEHRRTGIATGLYDEAERALGKPIAPSGNLTKDAEAFWGARNSTKKGSGVVGDSVAAAPRLLEHKGAKEEFAPSSVKFYQRPDPYRGWPGGRVATFDTPGGKIVVDFVHGEGDNTVEIMGVGPARKGRGSFSDTEFPDETAASNANSVGPKIMRGIMRWLKDETGAEKISGHRISGVRTKNNADVKRTMRPDTLWHGTPMLTRSKVGGAPFDAFDLDRHKGDIGIHVGSKGQAAERLELTGKQDWWGAPTTAPGQIIGVESNPKNPFKLFEDRGEWTFASLYHQLKNIAGDASKQADLPEHMRITADDIDDLWKLYAEKPAGGKNPPVSVIRDLLKKKGFDAIEYTNKYEIPGRTEAVKRGAITGLGMSKLDTRDGGMSRILFSPDDAKILPELTTAYPPKPEIVDKRREAFATLRSQNPDWNVKQIGEQIMKDESKFHGHPDIPEQKDIPRMIPQRKSQSLLDEVEERTLRAYMGPKFEKWAAEGNFGNWYDTFGTEQAARDALGDTEGPEAFKRLMQFMGATTARSTPSNNLRRAGYYRGLENAGLLDVDALLGRGYKKVPEGMGHIANNAHTNAMATLLEEGGVNSIKNPKPASFVENLLRNQRPFTNDTRMATGLQKVDPGLGDLGAFTSSTNPYGGVTYSPRDWAYAPMERAGQRAASEYAGRGILNPRPGFDPTAHFQAKVWDALGGEIPGASRSAGLFDDVFKSKLDENAKRWGLKPSEANKLFWQGHPFDLPLNKDVVPRGLLSMFR